MRPVLVHTTFLLYILPCPTIFIKDKLVDLIERTFQREGSLYIACNDSNAFFTSDAVRIIIYGLVRKCVKLSPFS